MLLVMILQQKVSFEMAILQVQDAQKTIAAEKRYKGIFDVLVRVPKEQ
uniref:Uncharacterized protein n=1 Tax=Parascaris equorum TaxID=6256 RepID=A0A914RK29_PAREQ